MMSAMGLLRCCDPVLLLLLLLHWETGSYAQLLVVRVVAAQVGCGWVGGDRVGVQLVVVLVDGWVYRMCLLMLHTRMQGAWVDPVCGEVHR